jgi:hypothetical protein
VSLEAGAWGRFIGKAHPFSGMDRSRAVRIPRRPPLGSAPPPKPISPPAAAASEFHLNRAGRLRAQRLFLLLASGLLLFFAAFVALVAGSPVAGVKGNGAIYGFLTAVPLIFALVGGWFTLVRAPLGATVRDQNLEVTELFGRVRRWGLPVSLRTIQKYPESPLSPAPTELVEAVDTNGRKRVYLVGEGFFRFLEGAPAP